MFVCNACASLPGKEKKPRTKRKDQIFRFFFSFFLFFNRVGVYQLAVLSTTDGWFSGGGERWRRAAEPDRDVSLAGK